MKAKGQRNGNAKLDNRQVQQVRDLVRLGLATHGAIAAHMGMAQSTVSDIANGHLWSHLPDKPRSCVMRNVGQVIIIVTDHPAAICDDLEERFSIRQ